jgi:hypothetical protein
MPSAFFITHPDVVIKPSVAIPDWPLSERGRARMRAMAAASWVKEVRSIFASSERKAREAAQILVDGLGLSGYTVVGDLCENDRSATGYRPKREFEAMVDAFFAQPQTSLRGWEPAAVAQARIVCAVERIVSQSWGNGDLVCRLSNSVAVRLSDGERRSGGVDLAQDVFALGFPHVAPGVLIARRQEGDDRVGQFSGRGKALFGNELGEVAKEALDQIHPG